jgi:hypothetical protein
MSETATSQEAGDRPSPDTEVDEALNAGTEGGLPEAELDDEGNPIAPAEPEEETEEVEHEGKKYALPKSLKPALLMQADYTRKTQELAEQRKTDQAQRLADAEVQQAFLKDNAKVIAIDDQVAAYDKVIETISHELANVDWSALGQMDNGTILVAQRREELQALRDARDKLRGDQTKLKSDIETKINERNLAGQHATAKAREECEAVLVKEFPKWAEERPGIETFAKAQGITDAELKSTTDPRLLRMLRFAKLGAEAQQRDAAAKTVARRVQPALTGAAPVKRVDGGASPNTDPNRMSTDAWMAHRRQQLKAKGAR